MFTTILVGGRNGMYHNIFTPRLDSTNYTPWRINMGPIDLAEFVINETLNITLQIKPTASFWPPYKAIKDASIDWKDFATKDPIWYLVLNATSSPYLWDKIAYYIGFFQDSKGNHPYISGYTYRANGYSASSVTIDGAKIPAIYCSTTINPLRSRVRIINEGFIVAPSLPPPGHTLDRSVISMGTAIDIECPIEIDNRWGFILGSGGHAKIIPEYYAGTTSGRGANAGTLLAPYNPDNNVKFWADPLLATKSAGAGAGSNAFGTVSANNKIPTDLDAGGWKLGTTAAALTIPNNYLAVNGVAKNTGVPVGSFVAGVGGTYGVAGGDSIGPTNALNGTRIVTYGAFSAGAAVNSHGYGVTWLGGYNTDQVRGSIL